MKKQLNLLGLNYQLNLLGMTKRLNLSRMKKQLNLLGLNNKLKLSGMIKQGWKKLKFSGINKHLSAPEKDKQRNL